MTDGDTDDPWGILAAFKDARGVIRPTSARTRQALLEAMNADGGKAPEPPPAVLVTMPGANAPLPAPATVILEDGTRIPTEGALPPDLPLGYHRVLRPDGSLAARLISTPGRCYRPRGMRRWGWAVQLYAARSSRSWGIGDLGDLARLAQWSASLGAEVLLVNPLHAPVPVAPLERSPYFPSSRIYRSVLYLDIEQVPGAAEAGAEIEPLAEAGRALNAGDRIDHDAILSLKMRALERLWRRFGGAGEFDAFVAREGAALGRFAIFCVLAERYGAGWPAWPEPYRDPEGPAVARVAREAAERVRFHAWLQWLLDRQLERAGRRVGLVQDLPIGVDPGGADAWAWQASLARGATVGAPPDRYAADGQNWGLSPFVPHRLAAAGYEPFVQTLRATLRHAGGLRVDHVMGLFRLYWIPRGFPPAEGAYVRYPADVLLAILALESHRAKAFVVGEDLGTVDESTRERLAAHEVLSYRLLWFEDGEPEAYPARALAAVTTHDLPTIRGLWTGADAAAQRAAGLVPAEAELRAIRARLRTLTGLAEDAPIAQVIVAAHRLLARTPCDVIVATLEDALSVAERPNMPGTTTQWPNWSVPLPVTIEALERDPLARRVAAALAARSGRAGPDSPAGPA